MNFLNWILSGVKKSKEIDKQLRDMPCKNEQLGILTEEVW